LYKIGTLESDVAGGGNSCTHILCVFSCSLGSLSDRHLGSLITGVARRRRGREACGRLLVSPIDGATPSTRCTFRRTASSFIFTAMSAMISFFVTPPHVDLDCSLKPTRRPQHNAGHDRVFARSSLLCQGCQVHQGSHGSRTHVCTSHYCYSAQLYLRRHLASSP